LLKFIIILYFCIYKKYYIPDLRPANIGYTKTNYNIVFIDYNEQLFVGYNQFGRTKIFDRMLISTYCPCCFQKQLYLLLDIKKNKENILLQFEQDTTKYTKDPKRNDKIKINIIINKMLKKKLDSFFEYKFYYLSIKTLYFDIFNSLSVVLLILDFFLNQINLLLI